MNLFTNLELANLETRFVALLWLLMQKGIFTIEEYEAAVEGLREAIAEPRETVADIIKRQAKQDPEES